MTNQKDKASAGLGQAQRAMGRWCIGGGGRLNRLPWVAMLLVVLLLAVPSAAQTSTAPATAETPNDTIYIVDKPNAEIPLDLQFVDEAGTTVPLRKYFTPGKPVILAMVYYDCPMLCGLTLSGLRDGVSGLNLKAGTDYEIVTISFNPREKPRLAQAKKDNYIKALAKTTDPGQWEKGWHFLTTTTDAPTRALGEALGFNYRYDPNTEQYIHQAAIYICTPGGRVSRTIADVHFETKLLNDSLVNASAGQLSSPILKLALLCGIVHYDGATGKYVTIAKNIMRLGGVVTILLLGGFVGGFWYRDLRKRKLAPTTPTEAERNDTNGPASAS